MTANTPFFQVPQHNRKTPEGAVALPIFYYDTTSVLAFFRARADAVQALLPEGLRLAVRWGDSTLVGLALYAYRDTSVGAYNEVGVAVPVYCEPGGPPLSKWQDLFRRSDERSIGFYIIDLPVTTALANAAGRALWNFPKFVTPIELSLDTRQLHCEVADPEAGAPIMRIEGNTRRLLPLPSMDLVLYSQQKGQWLRTLVNTRGGQFLHGTGKVKLTVGGSAHPMAERLRQMGLDGARPLALLSTDTFQSRLNEGALLQQG